MKCKMSVRVAMLLAAFHIALLQGSGVEGRKYITDSTDEELETWIPPADFRDNYRMYFAGRDDEDRPIWIMEFGKWDFKKVIEAGPGKVREFDKYIDQITYRMNKSQFLNDTEDRVDGYILLADMEGFRLYEFHSLDTFRYYRQRAQILDKSTEFMETGIFINVAALAEVLLNAMRPFMGEFFTRVDIYGTNKNVWLPKILGKIPRSQLPMRYGGLNDI